MPPNLALLLCFGFCFVMFWRERPRQREMDASLWLPTLWFARCASRNISSWTTGGNIDPAGGIDMYFLLTLIICGFTVLNRRGARVGNALAANKGLIILYVYMALSILWSDLPADSFKRWVRTCGDLIMALILITEADPLRASGEVLRRGAMLLVPLSIVLSKYFPALGRMQEKNWSADTWIGVATHKNPLGMLCMLSSFYFFTELMIGHFRDGIRWGSLIRKRWMEIVYLLMSLYLLFGIGAQAGSVSSTSKLTFMVAVGMFFFFQRYRRTPAMLGKIYLTGLVGLICTQLILSVVFDSSIRALVAASQGKDPGLAERTQLWADLVAVGQKHALLGAGYASFWSSEDGDYIRTIYTWGPWQSHSGYVETFLNLGLVGVALLAAAIVHGIRSALRASFINYEYGLWRLILITCCLAENYAEAGFLRPTHVLWFIFLCSALDSPALQRQESPEPENVPDSVRPMQTVRA